MKPSATFRPRADRGKTSESGRVGPGTVLDPPGRRGAADAGAHPAPAWLPAERLGQLHVDPRMRPWLIGKGLISQRVSDACGERYASRLADLRTDTLSDDIKDYLKAGDEAALFREIELSCDDQVWVFAQSVVPDGTLSRHPWIAELGDCPLGEILATLSGVERSPHEYAWLPAQHRLSERALRGAQVAPPGLWARRSRILLRGAPLLAQEAFLPAIGLT